MGSLKFSSIGTVGFLVTLLLTVTSGAHAVPFSVKQGVVETDEIWQGKIIITGDVVIPAGRSVTFRPGTWIIFNDSDSLNRGRDPLLPEIVVHGTIIMPPDSGHPLLLSIQDPRVTQFLAELSAQPGQEITAHEVSTAPLKNQWREHKHHYSIGWLIVYALALVVL